MKLLRSLYFWILLAFIGGCTFGLLSPQYAVLMEPLGTSFIKLIKVFIGPIVFLTVVTGIAQTGSLKKLGKIGFKAICYFEIVSTIALLIGWGAASLFKPGSMVHADLQSLDSQSVEQYVSSANKLSFGEFLQNLIPTNILKTFINGDMLQILLIAILCGVILLAIPEKYTKKMMIVMNRYTQSLFKIIRIIMLFSPLAIFGGMAFTFAKFGVHLLLPLLGLIVTFYISGFIFVFLVLGSIAKFAGFSILRFLKFMLPELLLVLGTSSSESALPQLIRKLENLGCEAETVGIVVPMGYSFNLDGTNIYISLAALFIAQALGIELSFIQQLTLFATAMLSSKGAAGVSGAGFVTLAATLSVVPTIPTAGIVLILGIDRFMSEARSLINFIGNGIAALVISRWENEVSAAALNQSLTKNITMETINTG
ncbi:MAG: C4-dicarboxylate transporter DctA [Pseudomonadota bacterium]|nr:C4-dicarboxylate transporter DctA [Pseudomonadota bacterium]